jgi:hypothetical protein
LYDSRNSLSDDSRNSLAMPTGTFGGSIQDQFIRGPSWRPAENLLHDGLKCRPRAAGVRHAERPQQELKRGPLRFACTCSHAMATRCKETPEWFKPLVAQGWTHSYKERTTGINEGQIDHYCKSDVEALFAICLTQTPFIQTTARMAAPSINPNQKWKERRALTLGAGKWRPENPNRGPGRPSAECCSPRQEGGRQEGGLARRMRQTPLSLMRRRFLGGTAQGSCCFFSRRSLPRDM